MIASLWDVALKNTAHFSSWRLAEAGESGGVPERPLWIDIEPCFDTLSHSS